MSLNAHGSQIQSTSNQFNISTSQRDTLCIHFETLIFVANVHHTVNVCVLFYNIGVLNRLTDKLRLRWQTSDDI